MLDILRNVGGRHPRLRRLMAWFHYWLGGNHCIIHGCSSLKAKEAFLRGVTLRIVGDQNEVMIQQNARVSNVDISVRGSGHRLIIGEDCIIKAGTFCMEDAKGRLIVGRDTTIESVDIAVTEMGSSISIGDDCMLAFGVDIRCGDSHAIYDGSSGARINQAGNVVIGNHVWVAAHVGILKGATLGDGCVIGTRSLVTRGGIPANSMAAGVPAKVLRSNIRWTRVR